VIRFLDMKITRRQWMAAAAAPLASAAAKRPNFVFILTDDHHFQCLGAAGNPHIDTPNLDRLARRGILFTNAQITTSQCAPSRGVLLSGLETYQNGLLSNGKTSFREGLGPTVVEQLRRGGYETTLVGKWHIANSPASCGFAHAPLWLRAGSSEYLNPKLCRGLDGKPQETPGHITELFSNAAIESIQSAKQPFFLWLAYNAPHTPLYASERFEKRYAGKDPAAIAPPAHPKSSKPFKWNPYYAVISELDHHIGRVTAAVEAAGKWEDTYIFVLGDNGYMCGARGLGGKVVPWEPSVRVPFIAAGGATAQGKSTNAPAASIDLPATWMELAGVKPAQPLAGRSLRGLLASGTGGPEEGFSVWDDGRPEALMTRQAVEPYRLVRTRRHKLIVWESGKQSCFDIVNDTGEERDLISDPKSREIVARLRGALEARMRQTNDHALAWLRKG
jgi:arylsulfatase A-like enzyme